MAHCLVLSHFKLLRLAGTGLAFRTASDFIDYCVGERRIPQHGTDHWESLDVAKDDADKVTEEQEKPVALHEKANCREQKPANDDHDEAGKKHATASNLALAHEKTQCALGSNENNEAHDEGHVADAEEAAVEEEQDAECVEHQSNHDETDSDLFRVVIKKLHIIFFFFFSFF